MNKAVFWDFDGTLVYANRSFADSLKKAFASHTYALSENEAVRFTESACTWYFPEKEYPDRTGFQWWEMMFEQLSSFCREYSVKETQIPQICENFRLNVITYPYRLYEDAGEILACCREKGYKNYILSNNYPELPRVIERLGIADFFDGCTVSSLIGYEKPRKEIFSHAMQLAGNPEICWMAGDNPIADIRGAQSRGIKAILVHKDCPSTADYHFGRLSEITALL